LLDGEEADLIFTDPPYNVPIDGHVCGLGLIRHREFAMGVGEMSPDAFSCFLRQTLGHAAAHSRDGAIAFVCMDWRHLGELLAARQAIFSELKNICVWNKSNREVDAGVDCVGLEAHGNGEEDGHEHSESVINTLFEVVRTNRHFCEFSPPIPSASPDVSCSTREKSQPRK